MVSQRSTGADPGSCLPVVGTVVARRTPPKVSGAVLRHMIGYLTRESKTDATEGKDAEVGKSTRVMQMAPNLIILAALKSAQTLPVVVRETDVTTISSDPRQIL